MSSILKPNEDLQFRIAEALEQIQICIGPLGMCDPQLRQRVTIDAITAGLILSTVTTVSSVTNIAAIAGEGVRQFEPIMAQNFNQCILSNLVFG